MAMPPPSGSLHDQPTRLLQTLPPGSAPLPTSLSPPPRRGNRLGCLGQVLGGLVLLLLAALAAALLLTPPRETVLILGSDARPDELRRGDVGRTDTLLVLVADRAQPRVAMLSLPRDLWVPIPGHGEERINAAYALGGATVAKQTVSATIGVPVERYAVVGLQGVRDVVDAVGGIDINVEQAIYDPTYPTDNYGIIEVNIPAGQQHMDGETALRYARTRHQDSDFGRIARQQRVLAAVRAALMRPATWPRIPAVIAAVQQSIKTDVSPLDAIAIAAAFARVPGDPERLVPDGSMAEPYTGEGGAALLLPRPALKQAVARLLGGPAAAAPAAVVEVLNGAGVAGAAGAMADRLRGMGVTVVRLGDADARQSRTTLLARPEARLSAEALARQLGLPTDRVSESNSLPAGVNVRLMLGPDLVR